MAAPARGRRSDTAVIGEVQQHRPCWAHQLGHPGTTVRQIEVGQLWLTSLSVQGSGSASPPCSVFRPAIAGQHSTAVAAEDDARAREAELYERARDARLRAQANSEQARVMRDKGKDTAEILEAAEERIQTVRALWLAARRKRMRYSAFLRLEAQVESMPVIEQAKGILMRECGWTADQAFDAMRRASQRSNIRVRDLAATIVANTQHAAPSPTPSGPGSNSSPSADPAVVKDVQQRRRTGPGAGTDRRGSLPTNPPAS